MRNNRETIEKHYRNTTETPTETLQKHYRNITETN